jgi:predicted ATPase
VGKTSLAATVTRRSGVGEENACWCDLSAVGGDGVADLLTTTLDVQRRSGQTAELRLVEYLRSRRLLLVLDNCEHVLETTADLVERLTRSCPQVTVLATSRERLGVERETVVAVRPLEPDAARQLFLRRAGEAAPGFRAPGDAAQHGRVETAVVGEGVPGPGDDPIGEICARLDGLPLAIELAATRMTSMHPRDMAARLTWRFRLLHNRRRPAPARHKTLRAVVDWSYDMLTPEEQPVFERLSVFAGSFSLEAAERVVAGSVPDRTPGLSPDAVADAVCELVERSLVVAVGDGRYRLLETLRAYGRERLEDAGLTEGVSRAHARWVVETAEDAARELNGPRHTAVVRALDGLFDELRLAHAWALDADPVLAFRLLRALAGYVEDRMSAEVPSWARRTLDAVAPGSDAALRLRAPPGHSNDHAPPSVPRPRVEIPADLLAAAMAVAAAGARLAGDLAEAVRLVDEGLRIGGPDSPARAFLLFVAADVALFEARWDDVAELSAEIDACPPSPFLPVVPAWALVDRVLAYAYRGQTGRAVAEAARLLDESRAAGNDTGVGYARYALGEALAERDPETALRHHEQAFALADRVDLRFLRGISLVSVASLSARLGRDAQAVRCFLEVVEHWHRGGNWVQQWTTMRNIAGLLTRLGRDVEAAELLAALRVRRRGGPIIGADAERLEVAEETVVGRLAPEAFTAATERGASRTDDEVVAAVLMVLREHAERRVPAPSKPPADHVTVS